MRLQEESESSFERENVLNLNNIESSIPTPIGSNPIRDSFRIDNEKLYEELVESFVSALDKEIKKVYILFIELEKKLYVKINSHLHIREKYE